MKCELCGRALEKRRPVLPYCESCAKEAGISAEVWKYLESLMAEEDATDPPDDRENPSGR